MAQADEAGFVKRGFVLLAVMAGLVAIVLSIIFHKPPQVSTIDPKDLPAKESAAGWQVRYNATIALLRRGSDQVSWSNVREMLDEKQQLKNTEFSPQPDGKKVSDESQARSFVITTLKALDEWQRKVVAAGQNPADLAPMAELRPQIELLAQSSVPELKKQAENTRLTLK